MAVTVEYDGTRYHGFQRQSWQRGGALRTVQAELEKAVESLSGERVVVRGAGRTDAGVHARGQVVAFAAPEPWGIPVERLPYALNSVLPEDTRAVAAASVSDGFNPRRDARSKVYSYTFFVREFPSPFLEPYSLHVRGNAGSLSLEAMRSAASLITGRHDFAAFRSTGSSAKTTVRTVFRCELLEERLYGGLVIRLVLEANGFLYNMARIIAGTLLRVGMGKISEEEVRRALEVGDRRLAGPTLPAKGLCLEKVEYDIPGLGGEEPSSGLPC